MPAEALGLSAETLGWTSEPLGLTSEPSGSPSEPSGRPSEPSGRPSEPSGRLSEPPGRLSEPPGRLSEPPGTLSEALGGLSEALGFLSRTLGRLSQPLGTEFEPLRPMAYTLSILALVIGHMWVVVPLSGVSPLNTALVIAAALLIHLPNPFLTPATFVTGLVWCWLYERHPNLVPIALSHAAASLAALVALGPGLTSGMRVGYGYFLTHGLWF